MASADVAAQDAEAQKQAAEAKQAAESAAERAAESAETASRAVESEERTKIALTELESGKLISSGVTGGIALALQFPAGLDRYSNQDNVASTAMPYVMFVPGYWFLREPARRYCASHWSAGSEDDATEAALVIARLAAKRRIQAVVAALWRKRDSSDQEWVDKRIKELSDYYDIEEQYVKEIFDKLKEASSAAEILADELIIHAVANDIWNPTMPGRCWAWTKLGLWLGKPLAYDAIVRSDVDGARFTRESEIEPVAAFGIGFSVNAYVSAMVGASVANVELENPDTGVTNERKIWAWTFGIGGNIDLLGGIFK